MIIKKANIIRLDAGLLPAYWVFACETATYLRNHTYVTGTPGGVCPEEAWTHEKPSLDHLRVFGCTAYIHKPRKAGDKLQKRG